MTSEELIELRDNITELQKLIGVNSPFGIVNDQHTGETALYYHGSYLKIRVVIRKRMEQEPSLTQSCQRALELVDEIDAGLAQYIRDYGKLPDELIIQ